jgi:hypothetical protein
MSHPCRNTFSAGVAAGASGFAKSWLGMPSTSVATAYNCRNFLFRDATIALKIVSNAKMVFPESEKSALSDEGILTRTHRVSIAGASSGRQARPQSCHQWQRHPFLVKTDANMMLMGSVEMKEAVKNDGNDGVGWW